MLSSCGSLEAQAIEEFRGSATAAPTAGIDRRGDFAILMLGRRGDFAMKTLGITAGEALAIEDSHGGGWAATAVSMSPQPPTVNLSEHGGPERQLSSPGPRHLAQSPPPTKG